MPDLHSVELITEGPVGGQVTRLRVPGGWIYSTHTAAMNHTTGSVAVAVSSVLVPDRLSETIRVHHENDDRENCR